MITAGGDGTVSCWGWDFNEKGKGRSTAAVNACKARLSQLADVRREQDAVLKEMQTFEPEVVQCEFFPLCNSERAPTVHELYLFAVLSCNTDSNCCPLKMT